MNELDIRGPKGVMSAMDETGDTKTIWDPDNEEEVTAARETFEKLTKRGFKAFAVRRTGGKGEQITSFDPEAGRIIMVPPMVGG